MNKKMIISAIAIALVAFIGFGLFQASKLTSIQIVKSVTVKSTPQEAFDMVRYLGNFPKWSPFLAQDPQQKYEVKGTDGTVGAQYHWDGNGGKDLGFQEIVKIDSLRFIGMQCDIQKPFVAKPTFNYSFKETPNGIEITQDFQVQSGLVDAFFMWLFGAKSGMEKTNQQGMDLLKKAIESK
jgi:hypothetical protein